MYKLSGCQFVLGIVILVAALWPDIIGANASKWAIVVAAILLLIHSLGCKMCFDKLCSPNGMGKRKMYYSKKSRRG